MDVIVGKYCFKHSKCFTGGQRKAREAIGRGHQIVLEDVDTALLQQIEDSGKSAPTFRARERSCRLLDLNPKKWLDKQHAGMVKDVRAGRCCQTKFTPGVGDSPRC